MRVIISNLPDGANFGWVVEQMRRMLGDDIEIEQINDSTDKKLETPAIIMQKIRTRRAELTGVTGADRRRLQREINELAMKMNWIQRGIIEGFAGEDTT